MKRHLLVAAVATTLAGTAAAQSTVNVYGRLNASVENQKDGDDSIVALQNNASRIGFRGVEDMGGGLKAFFVIEHGFNVDTGSQSQTAFWARESNVGLEGGFGRLRLGNVGPSAAYYATADYVSMHNHDTGTSSDAFYLYPGFGTNNIAYATPSLGGFVAEVQYGLKESGPQDSLAIAGNFDSGPLHLGASYVDGPLDLSAYGVAPVAPGVPDGKEYGLRALYEFGAFTVGGYWVRNEGETTGFDAKRDAYRLSGMYAVGAHEFHLNFGWASKIKLNGATLDGTDATQATIAYNYNLSKRTKVYAFYTQVNNGDNINYYASAPGNKFSSIALGLRHNF